MFKFIAYVFAFFFSAMAFAEGEVVQQPGVLDKIDKVIAALSSISGPVLVGAAAVVELVFRLAKTEKPLSILHLVAAVVRKLADVLRILADILDKVLPQRLK